MYLRGLLQMFKQVHHNNIKSFIFRLKNKYDTLGNFRLWPHSKKICI